MRNDGDWHLCLAMSASRWDFNASHNPSSSSKSSCNARMQSKTLKWYECRLILDNITRLFKCLILFLGLAPFALCLDSMISLPIFKLILLVCIMHNCRYIQLHILTYLNCTEDVLDFGVASQSYGHFSGKDLA